MRGPRRHGGGCRKPLRADATPCFAAEAVTFDVAANRPERLHSNRHGHVAEAPSAHPDDGTWDCPPYLYPLR
jgi:hypothetical protein